MFLTLDQLAPDLLVKVKEASPAFFEKLVIELLLAMGYGGSRQDAGRTAGPTTVESMVLSMRTHPGPRYLCASKTLGRHCRSSGNPKVCCRSSGTTGKKGIFITTSNFTKEANDYAAMIDSRIVRINGVRLCNLMIDHGIGVTRARSYEVKRIDSDYAVAYREHGYRLQEIAAHLGVHYATVSRKLQKLERASY